MKEWASTCTCSNTPPPPLKTHAYTLSSHIQHKQKVSLIYCCHLSGVNSENPSIKENKRRNTFDKRNATREKITHQRFVRELFHLHHTKVYYSMYHLEQLWFAMNIHIDILLFFLTSLIFLRVNHYKLGQCDQTACKHFPPGPRDRKPPSW